MKALILAAGRGTRLGPLTHDMPKPMLPVGNRPLLEHIIELLRRHDIADIAINLHHKPDAILRHFGSGDAWGVRMRYSYEAALLGSAGTALRHLAWVYPNPFVVYYGDVLSDVDLTELIEFHCTSQAAATIVVNQVDDPTRCGIVEFDASRRVQRFVEKPSADQVFSRWSNSGIYVLNPQVLHFVTDIPSDFGQDIFPRLLEAGLPIQAYPFNGLLIDIGTPENYQRAQQVVAAQPTQSPLIFVGRMGMTSATA